MLREQGLINPNSGLETFSTRPSMCATVGFILTKSTHGCCEEKKKKRGPGKCAWKASAWVNSCAGERARRWWMQAELAWRMSFTAVRCGLAPYQAFHSICWWNIGKLKWGKREALRMLSVARYRQTSCAFIASVAFVSLERQYSPGNIRSLFVELKLKWKHET